MALKYRCTPDAWVLIKLHGATKLRVFWRVFYDCIFCISTPVYTAAIYSVFMRSCVRCRHIEFLSMNYVSEGMFDCSFALCFFSHYPFAFEQARYCAVCVYMCVRARVCVCVCLCEKSSTRKKFRLINGLIAQPCSGCTTSVTFI